VINVALNDALIEEARRVGKQD